MINYFEIKLKLKPTQRTTLNNWKCVILGEERCCSCQSVVFHVEHMEDIPMSFNLNEVDEVSIKWKSLTYNTNDTY
jgi:hypothetical protein